MKNRRRNPTIFKPVVSMNTALQEPSTSLKVMVFIIIFALVLVGLVWQKILILNIVTEIEDLEKQRQSMEEQIGKLNSEILKLSNRNRLMKIGKEKLNMISQDVNVLEGKVIYQPEDFKIPRRESDGEK